MDTIFLLKERLTAFPVACYLFRMPMTEKEKLYWRGIAEAMKDKLGDYPKTPEEFAHLIDSSLKFFWAVHKKGFSNPSTALEFYKKWQKIRRHPHPGQSRT